MKTTNILTYLYMTIFMICIGIMINAIIKYHKDSDLKQLDKINAKIHKLDSLNIILLKRDSLRQVDIDSLKFKYSKTKTKLKTDEKKYLDARSAITLPDL